MSFFMFNPIKSVNYSVLAQRHGYDTMDVAQIKTSIEAYKADGFTVVGVPRWVAVGLDADIRMSQNEAFVQSHGGQH